MVMGSLQYLVEIVLQGFMAQIGADIDELHVGNSAGKCLFTACQRSAWKRERKDVAMSTLDMGLGCEWLRKLDTGAVAVAMGNQRLSTIRIVRSVLQSNGSTVARDKALQVLTERANKGNDFAQFTLGSLYQWGQRDPDSPVHRDLVKASLYLANAATHGAYAPLAMAAMAEIDLLRDKPLQVTIWAQLYAYYGRVTDGRVGGYAAELLARCFQVLPEGSMSKVRNGVRNLQALYGKTIRTGAKVYRGLKGSQGRHLRTATEDLKMGIPFTYTESTVAGIALYIVAFGPDGRVQKTWQINAMPRWQLGRQLRHNVRSLVAVGGEANVDGLRYTTVPVVFNDGRYVAKGPVSKPSH